MDEMMAQATRPLMLITLAVLALPPVYVAWRAMHMRFALLLPIVVGALSDPGV